MAVILVFTLPDGDETKVHLSSKLTIGRGDNNDVILPDKGVSTNHAIITLEKEGKVLIQDLQSSNGSFKNGTPIKRCYLQVNDVLKLHKVKVRIDRVRLSEKEINSIGVTKEEEIDQDLTLPSLTLTASTKMKKI